MSFVFYFFSHLKFSLTNHIFSWVVRLSSFAFVLLKLILCNLAESMICFQLR